jgi:DnaJ-class molecular chaperone
MSDKIVKCDHCDGTGSYSGMIGGTNIYDVCRKCGGSGSIALELKTYPMPTYDSKKGLIWK